MRYLAGEIAADFCPPARPARHRLDDTWTRCFHGLLTSWSSARVAGAATAMLAARAGRNVLMIDRGEYGLTRCRPTRLMRGGVVQLARWNLLQRIINAGTPPVRSTTFHVGTNSLTVPIKAKYGVDALYAPRRTVLDRVLVDAASEAGTAVHFGTRLTALSRATDGRVDGVVLQDRSGRAVQVHANYVVGADGMRSTVAKLVGAPVYGAARHAAATLWLLARSLQRLQLALRHDERSGCDSHERWRDTRACGRSGTALARDDVGGRFAAFLRTSMRRRPSSRSRSGARGERPLTGFAGRAGHFLAAGVAAGRSSATPGISRSADRPRHHAFRDSRRRDRRRLPGGAGRLSAMPRRVVDGCSRSLIGSLRSNGRWGRWSACCSRACREMAEDVKRMVDRAAGRIMAMA